MRPVTSLALALCLAAFHPLCALADLPDPPRRPSDDDVARARERFVHGVALGEERRWEEALAEFTQSYALSGSPVALFNIASTLRELGRVREARDAFDRLLEDRELDAEARATAESMRADVAAHIAVVTIDRVPSGLARVSANDELRVETDARPIDLELDPGQYSILVALDGRGEWRWTGRLRHGAQERVSADFPGDSGDDVLVWVLAGAGAAVAIGLAIGLAVYDAEQQLDPRTEWVVRLP
jgi:hypothetical protein